MADRELYDAACFGEGDTLKRLLEEQPEAAKRAPYSPDCASLLHDAAAAGHAQVVELLLHYGAPVGAVDDDGQTPLHHSAAEGHLEVLKLLAPSPACVELFVLDKYQMSPYHLACENGHETCVGHLLMLLERPPPALEPRAAQMRRGSAVFLAEQAGHTNVLEVIHSSRSSSVDGGQHTVSG